MFEGRSYQQVVGTAMGSPVSVVVANLVMEDIECTGFYPPATHMDQYLVYESQHPTAHMTRAAGNGSTARQCSQGKVTLEWLGGPQSVKVCVHCAMCG